MIVPVTPGVTLVSSVHLFGESSYDDDPQILAASLVDGHWEIEVGEVPPGRYWPRVHAAKGSTPVTYAWPDVVLDLPVDERLIVSPEALAASAKIPLPLTPEQRLTITEAILDAQGDVETYLNRPIVPRIYTERHLDDYSGEWQFVDNQGDPVIRVISVVPETGDPFYDDRFTVTYLSGLDARNDPALRSIRRFVIAHAKNSPEFVDLWITTTGQTGTIKSISAEGQSVSYAAPSLSGGVVAKPGDGSPGALPTLSSLDLWRKRAVYQARSRWWEPVP